MMSIVAHSAEVAATWPAKGLPRFVFERLDLSSFPNSTGQLRKPGQRTFSDLGIAPTKVAETSAISTSEDWTYVVQILGQRDYNGDGVPEVAVCFSESASQGTYRASAPYLVQLVDGRAVALAVQIDSLAEAASCQRVPGASR